VRLKITSDGTSGGTRIENDAGDDLTHHVKRLVWTLESGRNPQVEITFVRLDADLELDLGLGV
jgi:hypothetical protein